MGIATGLRSPAFGIATWTAATVTVGALLGFVDGMTVAARNDYFQPELRGIAGAALQSGAFAGAGWGLLVAVLGLVVALLAFAIGLLAFRSRAVARDGALVAVPLAALFGLGAYELNVEYLPKFLSATSLLVNAMLIALLLVVWWFGARALARYRARRGARSLPIALLGALALACLAVIGGTSALRYAWAAKPGDGSPNVLFVLIDTLRPDRLGAYGYHRDTSPNMDRLARDGWLFTAGVAQASWTKPSVASIFTGLYVNQTSVRPGSWALADVGGAIKVDGLAPEHRTLAEMLAAAGYRTGAFGNNHHLQPELGFSQGFGTYVWAQSQRTRGLLRSLSRTLPESWTGKMREREHWSEWINQRFLAWVGDDRGQRFFAYLHHIDVHWPYRTPPPFSGMYSDVKSPVDFNQAAYMPDTVEALRSGKLHTLDPRILAAMSNAYDEGIRYVDDSLGKVFDELKRRGLYDNTLIIVTADHGEEFLEHGLLGHGESLYDEVIRVPLIVKFPCPGPHCGTRRIDSQVELVDIGPTILQAAGLPRPEAMVGRSLAEPLTEGRSAFSEWDQSVSLRTPQWKLIYDHERDSAELYDLAADPAEVRDRSESDRELNAILMARVLDFTTTHQSVVAADSSTVEADERMLENLRALGYVN